MDVLLETNMTPRIRINSTWDYQVSCNHVDLTPKFARTSRGTFAGLEKGGDDDD